MNIKAVIYKKSRQPIVHYLTKQEKKEGRFVADEGTYFITEDDSHHITKRWIGPFRFHYITYYYSELCAAPLDFFDLHETNEYLEEETVAQDSSESEDESEGEDRSEVVRHQVMKLKLKAPSPQMFNEVFTPAFYKMVRGTTKNARQDLMYYLAIGTALAAAYIAWRVTNIWSVVKDLVPALPG